MDKIKIIVVDDSAFMRKAISDMLESENSFEVVAKFRDGRELIEKMERQGCNKRNLTAKIAGGASMFNFSDKSIISDIGKRNGEAVKKTLKGEAIRILAEEIGGNKGRTMILQANDGRVVLKVVGQGIIEL